MQQGQQAIERSAAASGSLLTGGTAKALTQYGQNFGSGEYQNVYNRALTDYTTNYNTWLTGQNNLFNRYASLAGLGQVANNQLSSNLGQSGTNAINILGNYGNAAAQGINNAAAARASGYVGSANAWGGALNNLGNLGWLLQMGQNQNPASYNIGGPSGGISGSAENPIAPGMPAGWFPG